MLKSATLGLSAGKVVGSYLPAVGLFVCLALEVILGPILLFLAMIAAGIYGGVKKIGQKIFWR